MIEKALMRFGIDHDRACEVARRIEVEVDESIVDLIEKETAELELPCDRAICRFESALKARRRL
jgi:Mn-dependent DtxR family transcriptional regulator